MRKWFRHDPAKWEEFRRRYATELDGGPEGWSRLAEAAAADDVALLYSSRDPGHNNAVALRDYLLTHRKS